MNKVKIINGWSWILLGLICLTACNSDADIRTDDVGQKGDTVKMVHAEKVTTEFIGVVVARRNVEVSFPVQGVLVEQYVRVGDRVDQSQALARLDASALRVEIEEMKASIREARAMQRSAKLLTRKSKREKGVARSLVRSGVLAKNEAKDAVFLHAQARSELSRTRALVDQRKVVLSKLEQTLQASALVSPIAGQIVALPFDEGATIPPGAAIVSIMSEERDVRFAVDATQASQLGTGDLVSIRNGKQEWTAAVEAIASRLDIASQLVFVEARLQGAQNQGGSKFPLVGTHVAVSVE